MEKIVFDQLKETLFHEKMANGLDVYLLPKEGFNKTYATFTTKYGSIDNRFVPIGESEELHVPDGIAHFLEHKLFEKEDGDVFQQFSKQGASANAFTSFTRTAYLFSSTSNVKENLETLIDFVQSPYFSDQTVEKEKGIIGQEITMYDDNPDWRVYFGLIENMYKTHPVKIDIAGTIESISKINKDLLYTCYETFYHPSNMLLFVVGPINEEEMMKLIRDNQNKKEFKEAKEIKRFFEDEQVEVATAKQVLEMPVQTPKCLVGFKAKNPTRSGKELLERELTINVLFDLLFGKSSENYEQLYNDGLIDDSFSFDYTEEYGFGFAMIGGDTENPEQLAGRLKDTMLHFDINSISEDYLSRIKKKKIGSFLRALNSPEYIANQFTRYQFNGMNLFDIVSVLEGIQTSHLQEVANDLFDEKCFTICEVVPK
ncbi:putative Zn-dependent peptidase [Schinkia azotoformans MEV2011]|uniref:Putative Zn-dependent peptidase n=1 Tax=Schinkia azotoformans MEV2011 TaxID=1348973 RepID=A0A072NST5_SCHAZ|nr:pitrilysin family protein [Schinkia azotoformans]KEF39943.1 putative Zn-dependent peptidase [Schinkia azotoformans MEV2011]MEC1697242.1 pitrilysin family protein [Schinkia azotoformans]MEC1715225.1 pitrilysin family protein [Schinkia azotoformans]MEC1724281.1 pitrilysin family protein [Schinkia azotoformans]MEC1741024.1 pitrilysin family protein [Schinkia azotoformans]